MLALAAFDGTLGSIRSLIGAAIYAAQPLVGAAGLCADSGLPVEYSKEQRACVGSGEIDGINQQRN